MRIVFDSLLLLSAALLPFWMTLFFIALGFMLFRHYWESVVIAALVDFWFRGNGGGVWGTPIPFIAFTLLAFIAVEVLRSFIRDQSA